jgi:branched-chain amino acid transport system permease protein
VSDQDASLHAEVIEPQRASIDLGLVATTTAALAIALAAPLVLDAYTVNVLTRSLLYAMLALTLDVLWGYTGILSYGQSAFFAIGAYALGLTSTHLGFSFGLAAAALVGGVVVAAVAAALTAWLAFGRGVTVLYVSVVTLALPIIVKQGLLSGGLFTGSSSGLSGFDSFTLEVEDWFRIAGTALVILTALTWRFVHSDAGRVLIAIRENELRCRYLGIRTTTVKTILMVASAIVAAAAGYAYAGYTVVVAPELAGFEFGTQILIWVALGGRGTLLGPVVGTLVIDLVSADLSGSIPYVWELVVGLAFMVVIVAMPGGFLPLMAAVYRSIVRSVLGRDLRAHVPPAPRLVNAPPRSRLRPNNGAPAVEIRNLTRRFGSLTVLDNIDFTARPAELVSLVGPNGAGKTTLIRCIADGAERTSGRVAINGHDIARYAPERCVAFGLGRKFQTATIFDTLSVADCLRIARVSHLLPSLWRRDPVLAVPRAALDVITTTGLDRMLGVEARHLAHGEKQSLELAMVLALEPSVLLLDEPTAGLTKAERSLIGQVLMRLVSDHRLCVLLIEHDLDFVREISSRVVVLHQGRIALDGPVAEVVGSELIRNIYAGAQS